MNLREKMVSDLFQNIEEEDSRGKIRILNFLKEYDNEINIILDKLILMLNDENERVRYNVALMLKTCGPNIQPYLAELMDNYSKEEDKEVKIALIDVFGNSNSKKIISFLTNVFTGEEDNFIRQAVIEALGLLGFTDTLDFILQALVSDYAPNVRFAAAHALKWYNSDKKIPYLVKALEDDDELVRSGVVWALHNIGHNKEVEDALLKLLNKEKDEYVKYDLIATLGQIEAVQAIPALIQIVKNETEPKLKMKAIESLGLIHTNEAYDALLDLFENISSKALQSNISLALKNAPKEIIDRLTAYKDELSQYQDIEKHNREIRSINKYRMNEIDTILRSHKSITIQLFTELLKFDNTSDITKWLKNLPNNLGLTILEGDLYDTILIHKSTDVRTWNEKISKIKENFADYFKLEF